MDKKWIIVYHEGQKSVAVVTSNPVFVEEVRLRLTEDTGGMIINNIDEVLEV